MIHSLEDQAGQEIQLLPCPSALLSIVHVQCEPLRED